MIIKDKTDELRVSDHTTPVLKGKTTIELRDAKTGELVYEKSEHNLVTNFFQGPYTHEICATYLNQPGDLFGLVKGVQLLNHQEKEDPSNVALEFSGSGVTGFGTLGVNSSQTNTKWMSYNLLESGKTPKGYKWVWNANENQCNGPIENVSLITTDMNEGKFSGNKANDYSSPIRFEKMYSYGLPMYIGKWIDTPGNQSTPFSTGTFSNIVHIDWENEILYDIERDYDNDKRIIIKRYNLNRDKINLRYRLKPTLLDQHEITFQNSLNHDYVANASYTYARPFSVKVEGNTMYMVKGGTTTFTDTTNLLRVIKINLTDYTYTDEVKTLTQTFVDFRSSEMLTNRDKLRGFHFVKDWFPIYKGYVYLSAPNANHAIYKINLNDVSDITIIDTQNTGVYSAATASYTLSLVTDQNILFYQRRLTSGSYTNRCATLSLENNAMSLGHISAGMYLTDLQSGFYINSVNEFYNDPKISFLDYSDGVLTLVRFTPYDTNESRIYSGLIYIDQYACKSCMVTINNVSPVVKTSDKTMKVTYELSELNE